MADIKIKYPSTDTVAITATGLASLGSSSSLLAGYELAFVDNTSNLDLDHLLAARFRTGTSPTAGTRIELWVYGLRKVVTGTKTYPANFTGSAAALTLVSDNVKFACLRRIGFIIVDSTSDRDYDIPPTSIAARFGGRLPPFWGLFATHNTGVALNSTTTNFDLQYQRVIAQA